MELHELKEQFLTDYQITELHQLHSLVLDECCESVLRTDTHDYDVLTMAVSVSFLTCLSGLRGLVEDGLNEYDRVKIIYRGSPFVFESTEDPALDPSRINFVRYQN